MKYAIILILSFTLLSCKELKTNYLEVIKENPYLIGQWNGTGKFLNQNFDQEMGGQEISISIDNNAVTAQVNSVQLKNVDLQPAKYGFELMGLLPEELNPNHPTEKDKLVFLLVIPENNKTDLKQIDANFHLKNNYTFDYSMKVGGVLLTKQ